MEEVVRFWVQERRDTPPADGELCDGVYLVARTYRGGRVLQLDRHFDRMESSARLDQWCLVLPRERIRRVLHEHFLRQDVGAEIRFRVRAYREGGGVVIIESELAVTPSRDVYERGVACEIAAGTVRERARAKRTSWITARRELTHGKGVYEVLLANDRGEILEGATSNLFAVRGDTLCSAEGGVLEGTARRIVLEVASRMAPQLVVVMEPVTVEEVYSGSIDEIFITSSTRGIVPISRIGHHEFLTPGCWTVRLQRGYWEWMERHLAPLIETE